MPYMVMCLSTKAEGERQTQYIQAGRGIWLHRHLAEKYASAIPACRFPVVMLVPHTAASLLCDEDAGILKDADIPYRNSRLVKRDAAKG